MIIKNVTIEEMNQVSDEFVETVENIVGMGHIAWDMVNPKEIIAAVIRIYNDYSKRRY